MSIFTTKQPLLLSLLLGIGFFVAVASVGSFYESVDITWGDGRAQILNNGQLLVCTLDEASGSGFQSKKEYLYGKLDMKLKLVQGNSAGLVTTYYLSSPKSATWDEIDFEFLGNLAGKPYAVQTNVFTGGVGNREMKLNLWFDPTVDFHTYTILWNPLNIIFLVDEIPIRVFKNNQENGVGYPTSQPMRIISSLWDGSDWATDGGRIKVNYSDAPFHASYMGFDDQSSCSRTLNSSLPTSDVSSNSWMQTTLSTQQLGQMNALQGKYMYYNYCTDLKRFPQGFPGECFL